MLRILMKQVCRNGRTLAAVLVLVCLVPVQDSFADKLRILTTEEPPMNYMENGRVTGFSTDIIREILSRVRAEASIELLPWARAYMTGSKKGNVILFTMARTPERERLFHWIGPLVRKRWVLFARRDGGFRFNRLEDARIRPVGVMRKDARAAFLRQQGFSRIHEVTDHVQALHLLMMGRVDFWASSDFEGPVIVRGADVAFKELEMVFSFREIESYAGISRGTPARVVDAWRRAFETLKTDGTIRDIAAAWSRRLGIPITGESGMIRFADER